MGGWGVTGEHSFLVWVGAASVPAGVSGGGEGERPPNTRTPSRPRPPVTIGSGATNGPKEEDNNH